MHNAVSNSHNSLKIYKKVSGVTNHHFIYRPKYFSRFTLLVWASFALLLLMLINSAQERSTQGPWIFRGPARHMIYRSSAQFFKSQRKQRQCPGWVYDFRWEELLVAVTILRELATCCFAISTSPYSFHFVRRLRRIVIGFWRRKFMVMQCKMFSHTVSTVLSGRVYTLTAKNFSYGAYMPLVIFILNRFKYNN